MIQRPWVVADATTRVLALRRPYRPVKPLPDLTEIPSTSKEYRVIAQLGSPGTTDNGEELEGRLNTEAQAGFRVVAVLPMGTADAGYIIMARSGPAA